MIGANLLWAVALGDYILTTESVPAGVPFAVADTRTWPNPLVLSEVWLALLHRIGPGAIIAWQAVLAGVALGSLALSARRAGASDRAVAAAVAVVGVGGASMLLVARIQAISLALFALLLLILRSEHRSPSWRALLVLPLLVLWANLHGAVLVGLGVVVCFLVFDRLPSRPVTAIALGLASLGALLLTHAGLSYPSYVIGVLGNEAADRGEQMWSAPSLRNPPDVVLLTALALGVVMFLRRRRPRWEYGALSGLIIGTALTARMGVWLLLFCAVPMATEFTRRPRTPRVVVPAGAAASMVLVGMVLGAAFAIVRGPDVVIGARSETVDSVVTAVDGRAVLAEEPLVEVIAAAGGTIWAGNPLDAFTKDDQTAYLDFVAGRPGGRAALNRVDVVVVRAAGAASRLVVDDGRFREVVESGGWLVYERTT